MDVGGEWLFGGPEPAERPSQQAEQTQTVPDQGYEGTYKGKTAAQWRQDARECAQRSLDSFDRCDTDGFVSQWANDTIARKYDMYARLAEKDGLWEFRALFTLTGALVPDAVYLKTRLNKWVWRIGTGQTVAWFDPSRARSGARRRANDRAKGYQLGTIRARGYVGTSGSGRGLSGAASVGYFIGQEKDSPVEIVDNGTLGTQYQDE